MAVGKLALPAGSSGSSARVMQSGKTIVAGTFTGITPGLMVTTQEAREQLWFETSSSALSFKKVVGNADNQLWGLKTDGTLWRLHRGTSFNSYGANTNWTQLGSDTNWQDIAAGQYHTMAVKGGEMYAYGYNPYGACGFGSTAYYTAFTKVGTDTDWAYVDCGESFTVAIKTNKTIYSCGSNGSYQTGLGTATGNTLSFTQVGSYTNVIELACGSNQFIFIEEAADGDGHGAIYGTGSNNANSMGFATAGTKNGPLITTITTGATKVAISYGTCWAIKDGNLYRAGYATGRLYWATNSSSYNSTGWVKDNNNDTDFQEIQLEGATANYFVGLIKKDNKHYLFHRYDHASYLGGESNNEAGASKTAIQDWSYFSDKGLTVGNIVLGRSYSNSCLFFTT